MPNPAVATTRYNGLAAVPTSPVLDTMAVFKTMTVQVRRGSRAPGVALRVSELAARRAQRCAGPRPEASARGGRATRGRENPPALFQPQPGPSPAAALPPRRRTSPARPAAAQFVAAALGDTDWVNKYLKPDSKLWKLTQSLPGELTVWRAEDVWQVRGARPPAPAPRARARRGGGARRARGRVQARVLGRWGWGSPERRAVPAQAAAPPTYTQCAYPVLSLVQKSRPFWLPDTAGVDYLLGNLKPGGRL